MKAKEKPSGFLPFIPVTISILFLFLFSCIALYRYFTLQEFHYDLGIFSETIWRLSQFTVPIIHHIDFGTINFLGDHFNPSIALLVPLFWLVPKVWILLFEQVLVSVACSYLLYKIAVKHGLNLFPAVVIQLVYLLFAGIENPLITDWHTEPTAGLFLLLFYYFFLFTKKRLLYILFAVIFLGFKESNPVSFCLLLIPLFVTYREKRKEIAVMGISTVIYFFIVTRIFVPFFNKESYHYIPKLPQSISELIQTLAKREKYEFVTQAFLSFSLLPLFSVVWLLPALGEMALRILPVSSFFQNYTLGMHYNVFIGIFLSLASIHGLLQLQRFLKGHRYVAFLPAVVLFVALIVALRITHPPILLTKNPVFWQNLKPRNEIFNDLKRVPREGSLASQNNLLPHLLFRKSDIFMIRKNYRAMQPQIIVFDLSEGQNVNNFFPTTRDFFITERQLLEKSHAYRRIPTENKDIYIFVKK